MVGLSLVAVLAIAAITASSASALPEWGKCVAKAGGNYSDANCTSKAKPKGSGGFEFKKGAELANVKFSGGSVEGGGVLTTELTKCEGGTSQDRRVPKATCEANGGHVAHEPLAIECEEETNKGEVSGKNLILGVAAIFKGCVVFGALPCKNGEAEGKGIIATNPLKGKLGYINKAAKEVGVLLEPAKKKGEFAVFECGGLLTTHVGVGNAKEGAGYSPEKTGGYDGIISPITPVNAMTSTYTQVFTVSEETQANLPSKFEGKHIEQLESFSANTEEPETSTMWAPAGESLTNVNTSAEPGEIKA